MQWNQKTLGTTKRKRASSKNQIFVTKIIIFIQNDKIKEPLSVLRPPVQYDGTIKHWELQEKQGTT